eukprot:Gb_28994 [translate_table: standard]
MINVMNLKLSLAGEGREWWACDHGGWATWVVLGLLVVWYFSRLILRNSAARKCRSVQKTVLDNHQQTSTPRISVDIAETHLQMLIEELEERFDKGENWEAVIEKQNDNVSYTAKCCNPKDGGPTKYISTTTFENCTTELLRDFYMDNEFRKEWDKTVVEHEQLQIDQETGTEIGRTIKKFPFLTPREYVLAWRLWEGKERSFYCLVKACEHPLAARQNKYKRVEFYFSGWRIRRVPGREACEIKVVHQEDAGLNRDMAKLAFSRGIWSYVRKMEANLRKYAQRSKRPNAVALLQKVPNGIEESPEDAKNPTEGSSVVPSTRSKKLPPACSSKWLANGLLLLGGAVCLTRGHSSLGAKLAVVCLINKLVKKQGISRKILQKQKLWRQPVERKEY